MTTIEKLNKLIKAIDSIQEVIYLSEDLGKNFYVDKTFRAICKEVMDCVEELHHDYIYDLVEKSGTSVHDVLVDEISHNQMFDQLMIPFTNFYYDMDCSVSISFVMNIKEKLKETDGYVSWGCLRFV